jgi:proline iminopeptidase
LVARITAPTLMLARRVDLICPVEFADEISRLIPGSDLRVAEGEQPLDPI